jgi:hypothetical protein
VAVPGTAAEIGVGAPLAIHPVLYAFIAPYAVSHARIAEPL